MNTKRPKKTVRPFPYFTMKPFPKNESAEAAFIRMDSCLGDRPTMSTIHKITRAIVVSNDELYRLALSSSDTIRRVARLVLYLKQGGHDPDLQKGLRDSASLIRCDTVRFGDSGEDRTRFYNHLVRMIRSDPDRRVRQAAGNRLDASFADFYSIDFHGLPILSRMLILDALKGRSRSDEECAIAILFSASQEASFRAARCLYKWGTLMRLFIEGGPKSHEILKRCAELGVLDYLHESSIPEEKKDAVRILMKFAGNNTLHELLLDVQPSPTKPVNAENWGVAKIESLVREMNGQAEINRDAMLNQLPLEDARFRKIVEAAFPPPDNDISSTLLFEIAKRGNWKQWSTRMALALYSQDADIRASAARALTAINPKEALILLPPLLLDPMESVCRVAHECMEKGYAICTMDSS